MQAEGFGLNVKSIVMQDYSDIGFANTVSMQILGSMSQLVFEYEVLV
jgi:hypothetical protein